MAIRLPDSEEFIVDSQVILVPIHESRMGEEGYEQMLREASRHAETYDKILVGVLESYCTYSSHPILGNIPVLPAEQSGGRAVVQPLTVYNSLEAGWRAVARGLAELLAPYRPFIQPGIQGSIHYDAELKGWYFDRGRKDGVSIWHWEVRVQTQSGEFGLPIKQVLAARTRLGELAGFSPDASEVLQASITHPPQRHINFLAEDHAGNQALIRELANDQSLMGHGINWTTDIPDLHYVLHFTQTHCYLSRAFEDTNDALFDIYLNPYRPLTKPIALPSGKWAIREFLKQAANWEFFRRLEAPYSERLREDALEVAVYHSQGKDWEQLAPQEEWVSVPLWAKQFKGGMSYENTIRIQLTNRSEQPLYISAFLLSIYFGSEAELTEDGQLVLKPGEQSLLFQREQGNIPIELSGRALAYNAPCEMVEVKFLASTQPFSTSGFRMKHFPGPPGSGFQEEEGYFMEKAMDVGDIKPLEGDWIAPLLKLRLDNPAYNRPHPNLLDKLLRQAEAEPFIRALYFESRSLAPRYELKEGLELQPWDLEMAPAPGLALLEKTTYIPDSMPILQHQARQLPAQGGEKPEKGLIVALGDSWFNQAQPTDMAACLMERHAVINAPLKDWGQLEEAMRFLEKAVPGALPVTLLLSPMGERLFDAPSRFIMADAPDNTDDIERILDEAFLKTLDEIATEWEHAFRLLPGFGSRLQVVLHGYDYFPGEKFGAGLAHFSPEGRQHIIAFMVDALNYRLQQLSAEMGTDAHYLDLRRVLEKGDWASAAIPTQGGFKKLTGAVSLFMENQYRQAEAPYPGSEYFLWQIALAEGTEEACLRLIETYPQGEHRAWAEEKLRELQPQVSAAGMENMTSQAASFEFETPAPLQEEGAAARQKLEEIRQQANSLVASNKLGEVFQLLDRELRQGSEARERLAIYKKEFDQLDKQRRRYKRPSKQLDQDIASLADAVLELVEGLAEGELRPPPTPPKEGSKASPGPSKGGGANGGQPQMGTFTDPRDGRSYRTVELNGLRWMAENLNFDVGEGCWFYDNDPKNGEQYGRLYTWEAAQRACPPGWRLPTDEEWRKLKDSFGGREGAYEALIEGGGSGFDALLGGWRDTDGSFYNLAGSGYYWSATENSSGNAWFYYFFSYFGELHRYSLDKGLGFSCRCVQAIDSLPL